MISPLQPSFHGFIKISKNGPMINTDKISAVENYAFGTDRLATQVYYDNESITIGVPFNSFEKAITESLKKPERIIELEYFC